MFIGELNYVKRKKYLKMRRGSRLISLCTTTRCSMIDTDDANI